MRVHAVPALLLPPAFDLVAGIGDVPDRECVMLVTNDETLDAVDLFQAYRDRADCESVFGWIRTSGAGLASCPASSVSAASTLA